MKNLHSASSRDIERYYTWRRQQLTKYRKLDRERVLRQLEVCTEPDVEELLNEVLKEMDG